MAISGLCRTAQFQFDPEYFKIISVVEETGTQICTTMPASALFDDYVTDSVEDNKIVFELTIDELIKAFRGAGGADEVVMKLTRRKGTRITTLRVMIPSARSSTFDAEILQDLPVQMKKYGSNAIKEYAWGEPNVYIRLPTPLTSLMKIADRFKSLSKRVTIMANNEGTLELASNAEGVRVKSTWKNMQVVLTEDSEGMPSQGLDTLYMCTVRAREWYSILQVSSVAQKIVLGIIDQQALVLYCYIDGIEDDQVLTYFVYHIEE